jgi:omega-6 fatty acid desaturase (delta-12 desaturase)
MPATAVSIRQITPSQSPAAEPEQPEAIGGRARPVSAAEVRSLSARFKAFGPDWKRSGFQLITTAALFFALLAMMDAAAGIHYGLTLLLAVPTAGLLVRLFIFQHDCGHGSFFRSRAANDALGRLLSLLTLTPYGHWRRGHAVHHASSGNLDRRGRGDVDTLTVAEYGALSPSGRLGYRLYRNPLVQVLIGAPLNFIILQRIPRGRSFRELESRHSILALNAALVVAFGLPMLLIGGGRIAAIYLPVMIVASWIGNWLFYVQHQFHGAYWERREDWDFSTAALRGSSYFELPAILQWFSGNIGLHHVHHLCSRVPNYHLQACLDSAPQLNQMATRITLRDSLGCWRLALWDEQHRAMVGFRDLKQRRNLAVRSSPAPDA